MAEHTSRARTAGESPQVLSAADEQELTDAQQFRDAAEELLDEYRAVVVYMLDRSSYREVARITGLSTSTLRRWKREAGR